MKLPELKQLDGAINRFGAFYAEHKNRVVATSTAIAALGIGTLTVGGVENGLHNEVGE